MILAAIRGNPLAAPHSHFHKATSRFGPRTQHPATLVAMTAKDHLRITTGLQMEIYHTKEETFGGVDGRFGVAVQKLCLRIALYSNTMVAGMTKSKCSALTLIRKNSSQ